MIEDDKIFKDSNMTIEELNKISKSMVNKGNTMCNDNRIGDAAERFADATKHAEIMNPGLETCAALQALHSTDGQNELTLPQAINSAPSVDEILKNFTEEMFEKEVRSTKSGTAAGADGWCADSIKRMCTQNKSCMKLFYLFYRSMLRTQVFPWALFIGSSIGIKIDTKPKPRPITIPEAFEKLLARILLKLEHKCFDRTINENQMGVKKQLGGERIIAAMQTAIDTQILCASETQETGQAYEKTGQV